MSYEDKKRATIFNLLFDSFDEEPFFNQTVDGIPIPPPQTNLPAAHLVLGIENPAWLTNEEQRSQFPVKVYLFVYSIDRLELAKAEATDVAHRIIMSLFENADFLAVATNINIDSIDPRVISLQEIGIDEAVVPPFGAVRLDVRVEFDYTAM